MLAGRTRGHRNRPQSARFRAHARPDAGIGAYLGTVLDEARRREHRFDRGRIEVEEASLAMIPVTEGQLRFERAHLAAKPARRAVERARTPGTD